MMWREPQNHADDCYFCTMKVAGLPLKNKKTLIYPNLPSAIRPVPHDGTLSVPDPPSNLEDMDLKCEDIVSENYKEMDTEDPSFKPTDYTSPQLFSQGELNRG